MYQGEKGLMEILYLLFPILFFDLNEFHITFFHFHMSK